MVSPACLTDAGTPRFHPELEEQFRAASRNLAEGFGKLSGKARFPTVQSFLTLTGLGGPAGWAGPQAAAPLRAVVDHFTLRIGPRGVFDVQRWITLMIRKSILVGSAAALAAALWFVFYLKNNSPAGKNNGQFVSAKKPPLIPVGAGTAPIARKEQGKKIEQGKYDAINKQLKEQKEREEALTSELSAKTERFTAEDLVKLREAAVRDPEVLAGLAFYAPAEAEKLLQEPRAYHALDVAAISVLLQKDGLSPGTRQRLMAEWAAKAPGGAAVFAALDSLVKTGSFDPEMIKSLKAMDFSLYNTAQAKALTKVFTVCGREATAASAMSLMRAESVFGGSIKEIYYAMVSPRENAVKKSVSSDPAMRQTLGDMIATISEQSQLSWSETKNLLEMQTFLDGVDRKAGTLTEEEFNERKNQTKQFMEQARVTGAISEMRYRLSGEDAAAFESIIASGADGQLRAAAWFKEQKPELFTQLGTVPVSLEALR